LLANATGGGIGSLRLEPGRRRRRRGLSALALRLRSATCRKATRSPTRPVWTAPSGCA